MGWYDRQLVRAVLLIDRFGSVNNIMYYALANNLIEGDIFNAAA